MQPADPARERFWQWFQANAGRLRTSMFGKDEQAREAASEELRESIQKVQPGFIIELGPREEGGPAEVIVSADGKPELVDGVKDFVAAAPEMPGWHVTAFRARMENIADLAISIQGEDISSEDIWFEVAEHEDGLNLTLHVRGLKPNNRRIRGLGAILLAQHAVGELDSLTLVNNLEVEPLPADPAAAGLHPFQDLTGVFDEAKARRYPPPGSLPIDLEGNWAGLRGTIGGSPAVGLLNLGLRSVVGHPAYDRSLVVTIPFSKARPDGMPETDEEYEAVQELGSRVSDELQQDQESLLAISLLTQGRREMIYYTSDAAGALRRLESMQAGTSHPLEPRVERDTFWGLYRAFTQGGSQPADEE
jgi:Family of unknown function (DUF695)